MTTTFRQDFRAGLFSVISTYQAANPTLLLHVYDYPPESYNTPCAYIEKAIPEAMEHDSGTRRRVLTGQIVIVNKHISNAQATHEQDVLIDGLIDALTATPHAASASTLTEPTGVTEVPIADPNGGQYSGAVIAVKGAIQEGRN